MGATNQTLIQEFVSGATKGSSSSMKILENDWLYYRPNYSGTMYLAYRWPDGRFLVNGDVVSWPFGSTWHGGTSVIHDCSCGVKDVEARHIEESAWGLHHTITPDARCQGEISVRHTLGAAVLRCGERYFLSSIDRTDGNYFLSELPERTGTVEDAFYHLWPDLPFRKPDDKHHYGETVRQGDIIANKTNLMPKDLSGFVKKRNYRLFKTNHVAQVAYVEENNVVRGEPSIYVHGRIYHRPTFRRADHRSLRVPLDC